METEGVGECYHIRSIYGYTEIVWEIENFFPATCKRSWIIRSPEIHVEGPHLTIWRLCLTAEYIQERPSVWTYLERLDRGSFKGPVEVNWMLRYPYDAGSQYMSESRAVFETNLSIQKKMENFEVLVSKLMRCKEKTFVVKCSMFVYMIDNRRILTSSKHRGFKSLSDDLTMLFRVGRNFDTVLKIGYKEMLRVHRAIICSRNTTLMRLIEKQGETVSLDYPNLDLEIVESLILYLYSGDLKYVLRKPSFGMMKAIKYFNVYMLDPYFIPDRLNFRMKFDVEEFCFAWTVDVPYLTKKDQILSPKWTLGSKHMIFQFVLYPNGVGGEHNQMSIFLKFLDGSWTEDIFLQLGIMDVSGHYRHLKCLQWSKEYSGELGFKNFVSTDILKDPLCAPLEKLKLFCKIQIPSSSNNTAFKRKTCIPHFLDTEKHYDLLSKEIASLFISKDYSDLTIASGVLSFKVHKIIMCCRSYVLKDMILNKGNEAYVTLPFTDSNVIRKIIHYLYSGTVSEYSISETLGIYAKAHEWAIFPLKNICSFFLSGKLKVCNVCKILLAAYKFDDSRLKNSAFKFVCDNMKEIENRSSWVMLREGSPYIYKDFMDYRKKL